MNYEEIGFLALSQKDYQEAINLFQRALERRKEARSYYGLGLAYLYLENIQKARWAFHKALEVEPNYTDALLSLQSLSHLQDKVVFSSPPSSEVRFKIGSIYLEINQEGRWSKIFLKE